MQTGGKYGSDAEAATGYYREVEEGTVEEAGARRGEGDSYEDCAGYGSQHVAFESPVQEIRGDIAQSLGTAAVGATRRGARLVREGIGIEDTCRIEKAQQLYIL